MSTSVETSLSLSVCFSLLRERLIIGRSNHRGMMVTSRLMFKPLTTVINAEASLPAATSRSYLDSHDVGTEPCRERGGSYTATLWRDGRVSAAWRAISAPEL